MAVVEVVVAKVASVTGWRATPITPDRLLTLRFTGSDATGCGAGGLGWLVEGDVNTSLVPVSTRCCCWLAVTRCWCWLAGTRTCWPPCTGDRRTQSPGTWRPPVERTRLVGDDKTRPACGLSRTGTPPFKLKEAWWKPFEGPVLVKLSDTGLEGARLLFAGKDVDEEFVLGACELLMLTLGVFVIVIALFPTLMGSWPEPIRRSTSWPEGGDKLAGDSCCCFLDGF